MSWEQFPEAGPATGRRLAIAELVSSAAVVGGAAVTRTWTITTGVRPLVVTVAVCVIVAALAPATMLARRLERFGRGPVSMVIGAALALTVWAGGRVVGVIAAIGVLAWLVAIRHVFGAPGSRNPPVVLLVGPSVVVAVLARSADARAVLFLAALVVVLGAWVVSADPGGRLSGVADGVDVAVRWVLGAVSWLVFAALALPVVVVPWLLDRITGWDPLGPVRPATRWVRHPTGSGTGAAWSPVRRHVPLRPGQRAHRLVRRTVGVVAATALVVGATVVGLRSWADRLPEQIAESPSMADAPWWHDYLDELEQVRARVRLDSFVLYDMPDVSSRYINIAGGRRATWHRRAESCRPIRVWAFGGSTMFGEGQRDDHTIPSELARAAARVGLTLDVTNWGALGDSNWIAARRLQRALAVSDAPPDVVVFYAGINEFEVRRELNERGLGADRFAVSYLDTGLHPVIGSLYSWAQDVVNPATDVTVGSRPAHRLGAERIGDLMAREYTASYEDSRSLLAADGIAGRWYQQPTLYSRARPVVGEPAVGRAEAAFADTAFGRFRAGIPDDVVDLTGAMDSVDRPLYRDSSHTNERGAAVVAAAIFDDLEPTLRARCETRSACC